ncbi:hypothetical protein F5Y16DRAFT_377982 [Xylariaceae sp. FL0255]|nr:hypothetical protein F5Y16DRAFT_377982 [Xylariaceae sp. FL0255]
MSIKVAIIGGGPAGLGTAIELSKRPYIDWTLYEKKPEISEIGQGITLQRNTWRMLELLGAAHSLTPDQFFRSPNGHITQHINGRTGVFETDRDRPEKRQSHHEPCRIFRAKLQKALLQQVDQSRVKVGMKLVKIENLNQDSRLRINFEDGQTDEIDLLIGADGIRSGVRQFMFPDHKMAYTGATSFRTVVPASSALEIKGLPEEPIFWHGDGGNWVYTCPLRDDSFEITTRFKTPTTDTDVASWGRDVPVQNLVNGYPELVPPVQELLRLAAWVQRFDYFTGPRLKTVVSEGSVALVGDASHPLSGAFGGGAGFALEDAHVLGGAIDWAHSTRRPVSAGLKLYDNLRTLHYNALYDVLDRYAAAEAELQATKQSRSFTAEEEISQRIKNTSSRRDDWMFTYQADSELAKAIESIEKSEQA